MLHLTYSIRTLVTTILMLPYTPCHTHKINHLCTQSAHELWLARDARVQHQGVVRDMASVKWCSKQQSTASKITPHGKVAPSALEMVRADALMSCDRKVRCVRNRVCVCP